MSKTIDITKETLIAFSDIPKHLPKQSNGKRTHLSACYRWKNQGLAGVKLETIFVAGTRYTSEEALNRFWHRVTAAKDGVKLTARDSISHESADSELEKSGW